MSVVWNSSYLTKADGNARPGNVSVRLIQTSVTVITHITHTHTHTHTVCMYTFIRDINVVINAANLPNQCKTLNWKDFVKTVLD